MRISTLAVAFLRPIWSMGPFDLPGGPNTNVSSPLANQVHSMTLCAMQVVIRPPPAPVVSGQPFVQVVERSRQLLRELEVGRLGRWRKCESHD